MSNSAPINVAYFIHLAHEITEGGEQRPMDHLVFFNGLTKYILPKSKFQDLNICNLADLEGGTPFVIDDKSIVAESDVFQEHTYIDNLLKFLKEDEMHSPKLFFQIATCDGPKKSKDYMLTLLDPKLDVKHPFSITMPFYALPQILKVVKHARISFGSKTAGFRRKTYPTIAQFITTDSIGTPTYISDRAITHDVLANLLLVFDARLIIGAPHHPSIDFLHLSDQIIAHRRFGVDLGADALGSALRDVYSGNERLLSKVNKYFSPDARSGTYAERLVDGLDATRTKVILIPDLNPAFRMREAEAVAKNLFDSGLFYPWIITPASQRTTEFNFSELNSCKANPSTTSEIKLLKPPINLGQFCGAANASYNHSKTSNMVHLMAYDYNPTDANTSLSTHLPFSIAEFPQSNPVNDRHASGYDTDPGTRFIVDFAVTRARLRTSKILDKLAKTCKFWPSPELTFRLNRHLRYTVDFSTEKAMQAFLNFCDNTSGHFAYPRNEVLTYACTSVPYFIRAAKGEKDPDSFMLVLQALFNLKNSEMFPVGNMTAAIRLPGNVNASEALRSVNKELRQDYFLSAFTPGKDLIDLTRQRPYRPTHYFRRPRGQPEPDSHSAWYALNGGEDYSNLTAIESVCRHINASNVHRAWSLTSGTSIIFNLSTPISAFEYGGRNFTVSPFVLGSELTISQVTFEPDFDKIFEVDSNEGAEIEDELSHQLAAIRHLRISLGLDSLADMALEPDGKDDAMDVAAEEKLPAENAGAAIGAKPGSPAEPTCPDCKPSFPCVLHLGPPLAPTAAALSGAQSSLDPEADNPMDSEEPVLERDPKKARSIAAGGPAVAANSSDKNNPARER